MHSRTEQDTELRGPGTSLREERDRQGLRAEDIASLASIPMHSVRAIENNRFDDLPSPAHARKFVSSYARALGHDPDHWLGQLAELLPHARSIRMQRRGRNPLDDRRAALYQQLTVTAIVALLWILYSLITHMAFRTEHNDADTVGETTAIEKPLVEIPRGDQ